MNHSDLLHHLHINTDAFERICFFDLVEMSQQLPNYTVSELEKIFKSWLGNSPCSVKRGHNHCVKYYNVIDVYR